MKTSMRDIFGNRNFRLLWAGEGVSLIGDQLYLVALPWLALQLTGNALATGTVLAIAAVPRALFMLVGGAVTDRFSPKTVMLVSNGVRMALVTVLAGLTLAGDIDLWMLYGFALVFGLADAFFFPAQTTMVPMLIGHERLQAGNALIQGTAQLSTFVGPALAGILIAVFNGGGSSVGDGRGIGVAFLLDGLSFLVSLATLFLIHMDHRPVGLKNASVGQGLVSSLLEGVTTIWRDRTVRYYFILIGAVSLFIAGPLSVGIPALAYTRFSEGAAALGVILSACGAGSLAGILIAGSTRRPSDRRFPAVMLGCTALMGVSLALLGVMPTLLPAATVATVLGLAQGYIVIHFLTWLQVRTPSRMLGRTMSLLMFALYGLAPLSTIVAGTLIDINATAVFAGAGALMLVVVTAGALSPSVWRLGNEDKRSRPAGQAEDTPADAMHLA